GTTGRVPWKNITMPPDLTVVGPVMAELYPQSGGSPIDGVFVVDPAGIAALMRFSGPVRVDGLDRALTSATVEQFILKDQYLSMEGRTDLLDAIARTVVADVLQTSLPEPTRLARTFGPLVPTRGVMAWSTHPDEQALFTDLAMDGSLATWMGDDEAVIARNNGGANKIDIYVTEEWEATADGVRVTFTNTAPATGLPDYVIGNTVGLPSGTSRTRYTLYTRREVVTLTVNGRDQPVAVATEQGFFAYTFVVDLAAGESFVLEWQLA
ncbi:MAG TPA: hypothetical protein DCR14_11080, partial [Acidimicrobiaceae bacterium]|nr:hypothetical protein [Acidimicrobiaceae bacterium]